VSGYLKKGKKYASPLCSYADTSKLDFVKESYLRDWESANYLIQIPNQHAHITILFSTTALRVFIKPE